MKRDGDPALTQCNDNKSGEEINKPVLKLTVGLVSATPIQSVCVETHLVVTHSSGNNSCTKTSRDADADTPNHTAHRDIPQHTLFTVPFKDVSGLNSKRGEATNMGAK
jgi:hypothetical protein